MVDWMQLLIVTLMKVMAARAGPTIACILCKAAAESVEHLYGTCRYTYGVRQQLIRRNGDAVKMPVTILVQLMQGHYMDNIVNSNSTQVRRLQVVICFVLWRERCK